MGGPRPSRCDHYDHSRSCATDESQTPRHKAPCRNGPVVVSYSYGSLFAMYAILIDVSSETQVSMAKNWGGDWTSTKLKILENYLDSYTTALKRKKFSLIYIDAFAGTGTVPIRDTDDDFRRFVAGSAQRAIDIANKRFDKLVFVDKDDHACQSLEELKRRHPHREIFVRKGDANSYLKQLRLPWNWRGVLFIDPYATQFEWATLKHIEQLQALDTWILFPTMAVQRVLLTQYRGTFPAPLRSVLDRVYGDESWKDLYQEDPQGNLFPDDAIRMQRETGVQGLVDLYKRKLCKLFGSRFLDKSATLKNTRDNAIFEFLFCVGHKKGIDTAQRIARHLLKDL